MARPRKPLILHKTHGTARKARIKEREGELQLAPGSIGDPPEWLVGAALEEWTRLTEDPEYSQVLAAAHRSAMLEYCALCGVMVAWAQGKGDISASQRQTLNSLRMQLGITPASQSKVRAPKKPEPKNKWAALG